ncbi:MAG: hypothetical protein KDH09_20080 [Chrysiogenetes bacterium]|nr:hypothetical protein [Chrysiogenetes bacterium]
MKAYLVVALACLTVMGSMAACSDDVTALLPGISVGASDPSYSGVTLAEGAESDCSGSCDGELDDFGLPADVPSEDATALLNLVRLWSTMWLGDGDIQASDKYLDTIADLEEATELTFNTTRTVNCNATGTEGSALGDASDGVIVETFVVTREYDDMGAVMGSDYEYWRTVTFINCLIEGDLLDEVMAGSVKGVGNGSAVRLNGSHRRHYRQPSMFMEGDPFIHEWRGNVILSTDRDDDGTFGREFWTHVVNIDAYYSYDGETEIVNGGVCAGEAIDFGEDDVTATGDNCVEDTDMNEDAWFQATYVVGP